MRPWTHTVSLLAACAAGILSSGRSVSADPSEDAHAALAGAQEPFQIGKCYGSYRRVDYHRDPILDWPCFEFAAPQNVNYQNSSIFAVDCKLLSDLFDGAISCKIDHPSFDAHFAAQAKLAKASKRDDKDPGDYCKAVIEVFMGNSSLDHNTAKTFNRTKAARAELMSKVTSITCAYNEANAGTAKLVGHSLVFYTNRNHLEGHWVLDAVRKSRAFPELEKVIQEYGPCEAGFTCDPQ
jgi:hypothetical protein